MKNEEMSFMVSERLIKAFHGLGLTDYEMRAYLALIEIGESVALEISKKSEIPLSKIYDTLNSLAEKGWIIIERGRPTRYRPQSPKIASEITKNRIELELAEHMNVIVQELNPIYERRNEKEKPEIWIIRGEENLWKSIRDVIGRATYQLSIALPYMPKDLQQIILPIASLIKEKGGTIQILLSEDVEYHSIKKLCEEHEVRTRDISFGGGVISDSSEVVLILMGAREKRPTLGIYSAHLGLTSLARAYFDMLWATSNPIRPK
ncbi:MAG: helix-turn-helix domain-containing protein [Nitrososphaerota archaeon]